MTNYRDSLSSILASASKDPSPLEMTSARSSGGGEIRFPLSTLVAPASTFAKKKTMQLIPTSFAQTDVDKDRNKRPMKKKAVAPEPGSSEPFQRTRSRVSPPAVKPAPPLTKNKKTPVHS
jgi:hypothetical protein